MVGEDMGDSGQRVHNADREWVFGYAAIVDVNNTTRDVRTNVVADMSVGLKITYCPACNSQSAFALTKAETLTSAVKIEVHRPDLPLALRFAGRCVDPYSDLAGILVPTWNDCLTYAANAARILRGIPVERAIILAHDVDVSGGRRAVRNMLIIEAHEVWIELVYY